MRSIERDYRYLLQHLIPRHRLSPERRHLVSRALVGGDSAELRLQAVQALEELHQRNYFERTLVGAENGDVVLAYKRAGGRYQLNVVVPLTEWERLAPQEDGEDWTESGPPAEVIPPADHTGTTVNAVDVPAQPDTTDTEDEEDAASAQLVETLGMLPDIVRTFSQADRSDPVLTRVGQLLESLQRWLGFAHLSLDVLDGTITSPAVPNPRVRVISDEEMRASDSVRRAIESGVRYFVPREEVPAEERPEGQWAVLGVAPVFSTGKVLGAVRACFGGGDDDERETRLGIAANVVRQVIDFHNEIETLTSVDALTGIYNRRHYDSQMPVEIERSMRSGTKLSLLVLDIDGFKSINDEMGHRKGDEALSAIAEIVRRKLRKVDLPFRYGGEEFVILLPGTSELESVRTAERLRREISQYTGFKDLQGATRQLTVSVGVSVYPDLARTAADLFLQADAAMFHAKETGKDRVVLFREGMEMGE